MHRNPFGRPAPTGLGVLACAAGLPAAAMAQCPFDWAPGFGDPGLGLNDAPTCWAAFDDDGTGPRPASLYVGGWFGSAGGVPANRVARWSGTAWEPLGPGISGANVLAMAVFDEDGNGPRPPALFVGGDFFTAGGVSAARIARWDGQNWSAVGQGLVGGVVSALTVFNDGSGLKLIAGGSFQFSGGTPVPRLARWNGTAWSPMSNSFNSDVTVLHVFNGQLYAGGLFSSPGNNIARWTGFGFTNLGIGLDGHPMSMAGFDEDGGGPQPARLFVAGYFRRAGGVEVNYLARWDGANWSSVNGGVGGTPPPEVSFCRALHVFNDGTGPALYLAGQFQQAGGVAANGVAKWDGTTYAPLGSGIAGTLPWVFSMTSFDDGNGPALWLGGVFDTAGGRPSRCVARWECTPCYPDCDTSTGVGVLDIFDFLCFQNRFDSGSPYACDCDTSTGPGVCDIFDFLCFQNAFDAGCP